MDLSAWFKEFRALHERAKRGALTGTELSECRAARNELARALLAAQHVAIESGQEPRRALRAPRVLQADITSIHGTVRVATRSIASGGFAALLARPPRPGEEVRVALRIPGGELLEARARVLDVKSDQGSTQVSFAWIDLADADAERVETLVFDVILSELKT